MDALFELIKIENLYCTDLIKVIRCYYASIHS